VLVISGLSSLKPNSPEFDQACKAAGPHFMAKPAVTVESIAYDWEPGTYPPRVNYFTLDARGNVRDLRGGLPRFPTAIKFTEGRCCQFEGAPTDGIRPFIRRQNDGTYFGIPELSADVLVKYKVSHIEPKGAKTNLSQLT